MWKFRSHRKTWQILLTSIPSPSSRCSGQENPILAMLLPHHWWKQPGIHSFILQAFPQCFLSRRRGVHHRFCLLLILGCGVPVQRHASGRMLYGPGALEPREGPWPCSAKLAAFCFLMLLFLWCFYFCFAILVCVYKCVVVYSLWFQLSFLWHNLSIFSRAYWPFRFFVCVWSTCLILLPTYLLIYTFI